MYQPLGTATIPFLTPRGIPNIFVKLEVVSAPIPALLGLDVSNHHSQTADIGDNSLVMEFSHVSLDAKLVLVHEWSVPLTRADSHVFFRFACSDCVFFTVNQLKKLQWLFIHPSANKLYKLLNKARFEEARQSILTALKGLFRCYDASQRIQPAPI